MRWGDSKFQQSGVARLARVAALLISLVQLGERALVKSAPMLTKRYANPQFAGAREPMLVALQRHC